MTEGQAKAAMLTFLAQRWNAYIDGLPLYLWLEKNMLNHGGLFAALAFAMTKAKRESILDVLVVHVDPTMPADTIELHGPHGKVTVRNLGS